MSGLLYERNQIFYDRQTDSLWSQLLSEAVAGPLAGSRLSVLPARNMTWGEWRKEHPGTLVMSFQTGYPMNYSTDPYADYPLDRRLALFVAAGGKAKIYPFSRLKKEASPVVDRVGDVRVKILFDRQTQTAEVEAEDSAQVTSFVSFLHGLRSFYPKAEIYGARH